MLAVAGLTKMTFAEKIRELSDAVGLSERKLAEKAGIPFGTVHNYFISKSVPSWINMIKLSEALGVECSVFKDCTEGLHPNLKMKKKRK